MRKKQKLFSIILSTVFIFQIFSFKVKAEDEGIKVDARSALLMEPITGKIIFEKNSHEKLAPASVTKIMTMLLAMEAIDSGKIKISDKITVSENAKKMGGSSMLLDTGEIRTVEEILKGIAIASGNDAAVAIGEYLAGSEEAFVKLMNNKAKTLGMNDTNFKNCTGLSAAGHITSAYDISLMSRELLKHPSILKYSGTYMETISEGRKSPIGLVNHNKLVRFFKGCDGLKTGFTEEARYCISATAVREGARMLTVIMGAPTYKIRNRDASMLLNFGFSKFEAKKGISKDEDVEKIWINKQSDKYFVAKAKQDCNIVIEKGIDNKIEKKCTLSIDSNKKEFKKGEVVGYCEILVNDKVINKVDIYCDRDFKKGGVFENLKLNIQRMFENSI